jgi:hypothetical protein
VEGISGYNSRGGPGEGRNVQTKGARELTGVLGVRGKRMIGQDLKRVGGSEAGLFGGELRFEGNVRVGLRGGV